ncbi:hypothetical protein NDU88_007194 [Pleurodeles waltl]|uniref:Uncharacterized protein n=1 Tax=Pleurodeles waltl TaxID=8319 RepID=A0AAV7N1F2_PLEWA|nr:hypothetical protein NDU88_007194 [Pleurodeles waltl]
MDRRVRYEISKIVVIRKATRATGFLFEVISRAAHVTRTLNQEVSILRNQSNRARAAGRNKQALQENEAGLPRAESRALRQHLSAQLRVAAASTLHSSGVSIAAQHWSVAEASVDICESLGRECGSRGGSVVGGAGKRQCVEREPVRRCERRGQEGSLCRL